MGNQNRAPRQGRGIFKPGKAKGLCRLRRRFSKSAGQGGLPPQKKGEGDLGGGSALPGAASKLKPCRPARTGRGLSPRRTGGGERLRLSPQNSLCVTHSPQKREASLLYGSSSLLEADFSCLKPIASPELPGSHSLQLPKGTAKVPGVGEAAERRYLLDRKLGTV